MAIKKIGKVTNHDIGEFIGLSTDVKPTDCGPGSTFLELDTKATYMFDGISTWYQI